MVRCVKSYFLYFIILSVVLWPVVVVLNQLFEWIRFDDRIHNILNAPLLFCRRIFLIIHVIHPEVTEKKEDLFFFWKKKKLFK